MDVWSAWLSIATYLVAFTLVWAMRLSARFRHAFAHAMPERVKAGLSSLYYGLWLVIALLFTGSTTRLVVAIAGAGSLLSSVMAGLTASLALLVAWNIGQACWRLQRSL